MEVALATNLSEIYISRIETGKSRVTLGLLYALCKGLKIHSTELIGGDKL